MSNIYSNTGKYTALKCTKKGTLIEKSFHCVLSSGQDTSLCMTPRAKIPHCA